ncbi:major facilitator superfamily domain-containing protein [Xylaria scruposa]|nr:major facilitator superfamily domain-containing protein [Xylaria scruposa]
MEDTDTPIDSISPAGEKSVAPIGDNSQLEQKHHDASALEDNVRKITGVKWFLVCVALYIAAGLYGLDTTIAADVQAAVVETFGEVEQLAWLGAGFPLGSVAVILPYGALFSKFNMKWMYIGGIIIFEVGSVLCGAAPSMNALIVGRVLAGVGGTGIYLGGLNHFSALCTREEKGTYITGVGFCWGIGTILGPVVGGGFSVSYLTWRWGFYINLIIGAATAPIYLFYLPPIRPSHGLSILDRLSRIDFVGALLSAGFWVLFSIAFIFAGGVWPWNDGRTITVLVIFAVLLVAYALQQYFCLFTTREDRSFPGHLLKSRTQVLLYISTSCSITASFVATFYIPLYFQFVANDSALMAAVRLLPFLLITIFFNLGAGWALSKVKYYMPFYLISGILMLISGALYYVYLKPSTSVATLYGLSVLIAAGNGLTLQLGYAVASLKVKPVDVVHALSLQNVSQVGSTAICLVIAGQVFQSVAFSNLVPVLAGYGYSTQEIRDAVAGTKSDLFAHLTGDLRELALIAVTDAIRKTYILVIAAGALGILASVGMKRERLFP